MANSSLMSALPMAWFQSTPGKLMRTTKAIGMVRPTLVRGVSARGSTTSWYRSACLAGAAMSLRGCRRRYN
eukprot:3723756-Alexandrium_andersonii.AAC.1